MANQNGKKQTSLTNYLKYDTIKQRIEGILGKRAPQFCSALVSLARDSYKLSKCDPGSVLAAAMTAAILDLPIHPGLGFAHIIPYGKAAQFQLGYKAYIQFAMRSGQYARMNAAPINKEAFTGYDDVGEPVIDWAQIDQTKEPVGHAFIFVLLNGFRKSAFMTCDQAEAHARRYSQAYRYGLSHTDKQDSPWFSDFGAMAIKTVIKLTLARWGYLSIEMRQAMEVDQSVRADIDAMPEYPDNEPEQADVEQGPSATDRLKTALAGKEQRRLSAPSDESIANADAMREADRQILEAEIAAEREATQGDLL